MRSVCDGTNVFVIGFLYPVMEIGASMKSRRLKGFNQLVQLI